MLRNKVEILNQKLKIIKRISCFFNSKVDKLCIFNIAEKKGLCG